MTLLSLLVRHLCGCQAPLTGWCDHPNVTDESEIADSIRFRKSRNDINHLPASISRLKYKDCYNYLEKALLRRGCTLDELTNLKPALQYDVRPANSNFIGRVDELNTIHQAFNVENKSTVVLKGIPGIGKSELASRYGQIYRNEYDHTL